MAGTKTSLEEIIFMKVQGSQVPNSILLPEITDFILDALSTSLYNFDNSNMKGFNTSHPTSTLVNNTGRNY